MLKRKITKDLLNWKDDPNKKALIIKGLRQTGKTFIVKEFAKEYYENYIYINFKNENNIKDVFDGNLDVDRILMDLSSNKPEIKLIPYKTLIIFDEIQECANARASLKPFVEDGRYDIIATGSLLGIRGYNKKETSGIPTGFEHILYMHPLDFEEFLWAKGISDDVISYLIDCFNKKVSISKSTHDAMLRYFNEYICVGGMPEIVNIFIETKDMNRVYDKQKDILEEYKDDFGKHLNKFENEEIDKKLLSKILDVFSSIPAQLAKENKKFQYSLIKKSSRGSEYADAIQWLVDFGIISKCYNLNNLSFPLEGNKNSEIFKIYINDTGLFMGMLDKGTSYDVLTNNLGLYKGAIFENAVSSSFVKMDRNLYYYHKDSGLEIDFITRYNNQLTLVEVKSTNGNTKSSQTILNNPSLYNVKQMIKLSQSNIGYSNNILTIPYYLSFLLKE